MELAESGVHTVFMSTAELAGIPVWSIGEKVGSLKGRSYEIVAALDFLFTSFRETFNNA